MMSQPWLRWMGHLSFHSESEQGACRKAKGVKQRLALRVRGRVMKKVTDIK